MAEIKNIVTELEEKVEKVSHKVEQIEREKKT